MKTCPTPSAVGWSGSAKRAPSRREKSVWKPSKWSSGWVADPRSARPPLGGLPFRVWFRKEWGLSLVPFLFSIFPCCREKRCWGNVESFAQLLDVGFVELAFPVQDLGYDAFRAKSGDQVFLAEVIGVHQCAKDFHWGSIRNGVMLFFISFDQGHQDRGILFFIPGRVFLACQLIQDRKVFVVLTLGCNRCRRANFQRIFFGYSNHHFCHSFSS